MKIGLLALISAVLFGGYDLVIKLTATKSDPALGALLVQVSSAITLAIILTIQFLRKRPEVMISNDGWKYSILAGVLISLALYALFAVLKSPLTKASTTLPSILIGRNIVLIMLSLVLLGEKLTKLQILGLLLGIAGLGIINL
ncbi:EamA family transporter [Patescibacteria group bacterium]|nr:EamA family transporter [Patescibacteria group bacterium]